MNTRILTPIMVLALAAAAPASQAAIITLVGIDEVKYTFGASHVHSGSTSVSKSYFGDHAALPAPHRGGYRPAYFGLDETHASPNFDGTLGYNFTQSSITVASERSVDNQNHPGRAHGAADAYVRATFQVKSDNGRDNVDVFLTSMLDGLFSTTVNTAEVSQARAVASFRTPKLDRYYQQQVLNDGVLTPQYTWSIYDALKPPGQRLRNVTVPGDGFKDLGTISHVDYTTGEEEYFMNVPSGTLVPVFAFLSTGVDVTGLGAKAFADFYSSGHARLTARDHAVAEPSSFLLLGTGALLVGLQRRRAVRRPRISRSDVDRGPAEFGVNRQKRGQVRTSPPTSQIRHVSAVSRFAHAFLALALTIFALPLWAQENPVTHAANSALVAAQSNERGAVAARTAADAAKRAIAAAKLDKEVRAGRPRV